MQWKLFALNTLSVLYLWQHEGERKQLKFINVNEAIEWLNAQRSTGQGNSVERVKVALAFIDNPHIGLPAIHITGTNGKGSTTAFLRELLLSQGLQVGTFTSPHIMTFKERFTFNGELISDEDLLFVIEEMVQINDYMEQTEFGRLVFFELYTVMMAIYFNMKKPDVCLVEVGIGGRRDCTSVVNAQLAIITTIGLDHGDKLGNTVEEVAEEKSGLIKPNSLVVTGLIDEGPLTVIENYAKEMNSEIYRYQIEYGMSDILNHLDQGSTFNFWQTSTEAEETQQNNFAIGMLGLHQVQNATVALQAFELWMRHIEQPIDWVIAKPALQKTNWIARMERIHEEPFVYIDGAHNVAGLNALKQLVTEYFPHKEIHILYAGLDSKNQAAQLPLLSTFESSSLAVTEFEHPNAMSLEQFKELVLSEATRLKQPVQFVENWPEYITDFIFTKNADQMLLVTGSLYFVSAIRQHIVKEFQKISN